MTEQLSTIKGNSEVLQRSLGGADEKLAKAQTFLLFLPFLFFESTAFQELPDYHPITPPQPLGASWPPNPPSPPPPPLGHSLPPKTDTLTTTTLGDAEADADFRHCELPKH